MNPEVDQICEILEELLDELPLKAKEELEKVLDLLKKRPLDIEDLMRIQDDLEVISSIPNIDNFSRNEIINAISSLEMLSNS